MFMSFIMLRATYNINLWNEYLSETTNQIHSTCHIKFSREDGGGMLLRNADIYLQVQRATQPRYMVPLFNARVGKQFHTFAESECSSQCS